MLYDNGQSSDSSPKSFNRLKLLNASLFGKKRNSRWIFINFVYSTSAKQNKKY